MKATWINKTPLLISILAATLSTGVQADSLPGAGIEVQPVQSTIVEESFQTLIANKAMEALGYTVHPTKLMEHNVGMTSVAIGDATYFTSYWTPLHENKYINSGGDEKFYTGGAFISNAAQGYLIDKKTADKYNITNISQLKDPEIAKLFDVDGDGKADLIGCNPGWGCAEVMGHQIPEFGLSDTVTEVQGNYSAIIADTIARYKNGDPVLYYTWTPYWVSALLVPGKDVVWLEVPYSSLPGARKGIDTALPNGKNYGFEMNSINILANKKFVEENPAVEKLFSIMTININDINAQNRMMRQGQNKTKDIEAHANGWIKAHQATFDAWIAESIKAAK